MLRDSTLRLVHVYPQLLGTYGDGGNALTLRHRALRRGITVDVIQLEPSQAVPCSGDIYLLGGGEDRAQVAAARLLRRTSALTDAVSRGAAVLAVCAGFQLLGSRFPGSDGRPEPGLGLLDATTERLPRRAIGEVVVDPKVPGMPVLTGYENHAGRTRLGSAAQPLGNVLAGIGNGDGTDGAFHQRIVATYLHGPLLARNPALADLLLAWGCGGDLPALAEPEVDRLRAERLGAVRRKHRWSRRRPR
jgi:CobQ-like glutamine amidotransferase family enzyme